MRPSGILVSILCLTVMAAISGCSTSTETANGGNGGGGGSNGRSGALVVPAIIDFDSVVVGQSHDKLVPFLNTGTDSITITSNGLSAVDAQDTNFFHPVVIGPNGFPSFHIQFDAAGPGLRTASDTIHYTVGGAPSIAIMTLRGTASAGTSGGGPLIAIPNSVSFGSATVGQPRDTILAIYNPSGGGPVTILMNQTSSGELVDTNFRSSVTLASGRGIVIHVQFNPSQAGPRSATDQITYTSGGSVQTLSIVFTARGVTGGGGTGGGTTPGPGSTFTYDTWQVDTNGNTSVHADSTYTIVSNSTSYMGKTNVMAIRGPDGSISYYNVAANGDISAYVDFSASGAPMPSQWFTIPIGSKTEITKTLFDSSVTTTYQGLPVTLQITATSDAKYLGSPSVTAAGKSFATNYGSLAIVVGVSGFGGLISTTNTSTTNIWYSNALGYYPKRQDVQSSSGGLGQTATTSSANYLLKSDVIK